MTEKSPETSPAIRLIIAPELEALGIKAKGALIRGAEIKKNLPGALKRHIKTELTRVDIRSLLESPVVNGYRELYRLHGEQETAPASETLLRLIEKQGRLPNINTIVDSYNMVVAQTGYAIGAHDAARLKGNVTIRKTDGTEQYTPIMQTEPVIVPAGKYAAVDDSGEVICWMETRQSNVTKIVPGQTEEVFLYVQGNQASSKGEVCMVLQHVCDTIKEYCGGSYMLLS
ncbi:hypothetical protein JW752_04695 [Candidatus Peregrinibacteria bacterium]|nr:hypothetical protein [Candidatus Peregrinibacteria bacterium]